MKQLFITISFVFICLFANAQENNQLNEMLSSSLISYIDRKSDLIKRTNKDSLETVFQICVDCYPNNISFSQSLKSRNVKLIKMKKLFLDNKLKKDKEYVTINMGMSLERNQIIITLSGRGMSLPNKSKLIISPVDQGKFTYEYSVENQRWVLKHTEFISEI